MMPQDAPGTVDIPGGATVPVPERLLALLDAMVESLLALALAVLVAVGGAQVIWRFVLNDPLSWTIEVSILILIWATMLSAYVGVRRDLHLSADFLGLSMDSRLRWWIQLASLVLSGVFTVAFGWTSRDIIDAMTGIPYTSIPLGQEVAYLSLPVAAVLVLVALAGKIRVHLLRRGEPR